MHHVAAAAGIHAQLPGGAWPSVNSRTHSHATLHSPRQAEGALDRNPYETSKPNELLMKLRRPEPYYAVSCLAVVSRLAVVA